MVKRTLKPRPLTAPLPAVSVHDFPADPTRYKTMLTVAAFREEVAAGGWAPVTLNMVDNAIVDGATHATVGQVHGAPVVFREFAPDAVVANG